VARGDYRPVDGGMGCTALAGPGVMFCEALRFHENGVEMRFSIA
jgi:hypothetical protein